MDNSSESLFSSLECNDLFRNIKNIVNCCIYDIELTEFQRCLKAEIDARLSEINIILPWSDYEKLEKYPYAKIMYNLSIPITNFVHWYVSVFSNFIYNRFYNLIMHRDIYNLSDIEGYYCVSLQCYEELNMLISEDCPGYSIEISNIEYSTNDDTNSDRYYIKLINNNE